MKSMLLGALLLLPALTQAMEETKTQNAFLQELEAAKYTLSYKYAPTEWKSEYLQWDPDIAVEIAKSRVFEKEHLSTRDYQRIYRDFLGSLQDYHVRAMFFSTELSVFPIKVKGVNNRYFVTAVEPDLNAPSHLDPDPFDPGEYLSDLKKIQIGDEIVALNGIPMSVVIENLIDSELSGNRTPTDYALAQRMVFRRNGMLGCDVPAGEFVLTINPQSDHQYDVRFPWIHVKEWVTDPSPKDLTGEPKTLKERLEKLVSRDFSVSLAKEMINSPLSHSEEECDNRVKSFVPPLGTILWETEMSSDHYAYIYLNECGKKIGYFYIPNFMTWEPDIYMDELIEIIKRFESETDALVVDINDNPGGSVFYMYGLLSLLTDKPLLIPKETEVLDQGDIYIAAMVYNDLRDVLEEGDIEEIVQETLDGYPITEEVLVKIVNYLGRILDQWNAGVRRTAPDHIYGIDCIEPHPKAHYTKPIFVLTNELDFSCGDIFPAILQDNGRAVLFGRKTAGAGGCVQSYSLTSQFGILGYSLTKSLAYRIDGSVIENLGVTPDIPYELSERDLQSNYIDYIQAVNREVNLLIE